jgi:hypothetical protein
MRLKSSARYGLTVGGYNDVRISLTEAGRAAIAPKSEEERRLALVDCALRPDVFRTFYESLDGKRLPEAAFARNILERDHNIDPELAQECLDIIVANGTYVGLLREISGSLWVSVSAVQAPESAPVRVESPGTVGDTAEVGDEPARPTSTDANTTKNPPKVFVGHFGSPDAADQVGALLGEFGIVHTIVDVGRRAGAPMSTEVSGAMRECSSAVLVAGSSGDEATVSQLLGFMVGAASVLYGARLVVAISEGSVGSALSDLSVRVVELQSGSQAESALDVLKALNEAGVVHVTS